MVKFLATGKFAMDLQISIVCHFLSLEHVVQVIRVVAFSSGVHKIRKIFCLRINIPKGNYWILQIGLLARCQKLGIILENKVIKKLMLSKNVNNKKCAPKLVFFNKNQDSDDFWHRKLWLWKSDFGTFWHLPITPILKIQ